MKLNLPAWIGALALLISCFSVSCANRHSEEKDDDSRIEIIGAKSIAVKQGITHRKKVPDRMLATAHEIVPGFEIESAERELERGEASWSFEGTARGREIELEIEDGEVAVR